MEAVCSRIIAVTRSCIRADRSRRPSKKARISALDMTHGELSRILRIDSALVRLRRIWQSAIDKPLADIECSSL
jgi:hypothetical protein